MFAASKPAIVVTPPAAGTEVTPGKRLFACFGVPVTVFGNGIIGTIDAPACNGEAENATQNRASLLHA